MNVSGLVRLRLSLSNPSTPLLRLFKALDKQAYFKSLQPNPDTKEAIIVQTGAADSSTVRLQVKENRKLSPSQIDELVGAYVAGASILALKRRFCVHEQTVRAHLRRHGVNLRPIRILATTQEIEAERLYVEMIWSMEEIAAKFNVSETTIRNVLIRRGVKPRGHERRAIDTTHTRDPHPHHHEHPHRPHRAHPSPKDIP